MLRKILCLCVILVSGCKDDGPVEPQTWNGPRFSYPTAVGTTWVYSYGSFSGTTSQGTGTNVSYSSTRVWEVIRKEDNSSGMLVVIKATTQASMKFVKTYSQGSLVSVDSTGYPDTWTVFGIQIGPESISPDWASTVGSASGLPVSFSRRLASAGDTVSVFGSDGFSHAYYADSVGLYSYGVGHTNMGSGFGESLLLVSLTPPPQ